MHKVPSDIGDDLLQDQQIGKTWNQEFVTVCFTDDSSFDKLFCRRKVKNVTAAAPKNESQGKAEKVNEFKNTHDVFGRLICTSLVRKKWTWQRF